ncbi:RluA family pseudouridine synthase, partial [Bacteroidota bacterium]
NAAKSDCILVNGIPVKNNYKVKPSDEISIVLPEPPRDTEIKAENIPLEIVYEDESILLVNKVAGMVVHPAHSNYTGTLVNALLYHFGEQPADDNTSYRAGLVHRIDKDTSGLLVIAKTDVALSFLARQFFDHSMERKYLALVWGDMKADSGTIDARLTRDPKDRRRMVVTSKEDIGKHAITHYKVVERFLYVTLIECRLETGRTHQIRAHLSSVGHPLFNDEMYGGSKILFGPSFSRYMQFIKNCFKLMPRQALHAKTLGFIHPESRKQIAFSSELPDDFTGVLEKWRIYSKFSVNSES